MSRLSVKKDDKRWLPVFLLVDTSGSMHGEKINCVNTALREMIQIFSDLKSPKGAIKLNVITFGKTIEILHLMKNPKDLVLDELDAYGPTPLGGAIEKAVEIMEDKNILSDRHYYSTIVLISDGRPTDCAKVFLDADDFSGWEPMKKLFDSEYAGQCQRLALSIGDDANINVLKKFVNEPRIPIVKANNLNVITKFFQWVTMSVSVRSQSANPNELLLCPAKDYFGDEELVF